MTLVRSQWQCLCSAPAQSMGAGAGPTKRRARSHACDEAPWGMHNPSHACDEAPWGTRLSHCWEGGKQGTSHRIWLGTPSFSSASPL